MDAASLSAAVLALAAALDPIPAPAPAAVVSVDTATFEIIRTRTAQLLRLIPPPAPPTRHPRLYFPDGNIVLAAPGAGSKNMAVFRVHQSILARQSSIFADLFTLPPPISEPVDKYDGVRLVCMPDTAEDIETLLTVLYDPDALPHARGLPDTPERVRGALALATKYGADALRARIISHFAADWPTNLLAWDALRRDEATLAGTLADVLHEDRSAPCLIDRVPEPASAVRLARDWGIPDVLPAAFYELARSTTEDDWDAVHADPQRHVDGERGVRWGLLTADDLRMLLTFRERMRISLAAFNMQLHTAPSCRTEAACELRLIIARSRLQDSRDPLTLLDYDNRQSIWANCDVCGVCRELGDLHYDYVREAFWSELEDFVA